MLYYLWFSRNIHSMQRLPPLAVMLIPLRDNDPAHDNEYFSGLPRHSTEIIKGTDLELINLNNSILGTHAMYWFFVMKWLCKEAECIPLRTITQHKIPPPSRFISRGITLNTSYENRKASVRFTVRRNWEQSGSNVYPNFQNSLVEQIPVYKTTAILKAWKPWVSARRILGIEHRLSTTLRL